jgi:ActD protein
MTERSYGIMAEFRTPETLMGAVRAAKHAGYTRLDAFSPFPLPELARELGIRTSAIPWIALIAGLVGAGIQYASQYWMNAVDYPLNVGGRPLHSWPAFIPASLIVAILWAGAATLIGLLLILRLPRLHHPVFAVPGFERASEDRFFLCIMQDDPIFDNASVREFFGVLSPLAVQEVPACG